MQMMAFLSGLPRSGSTLLSAILSQNPEIHAEGNSALCTLMWDAQVSCQSNAWQQLAANRRHADQDALVSAIPAIYYRNTKATHIVDKCRSWTLPANMEMIRRYITPDPKVIVLLRPLDEIFASFARLYERNAVDADISQLMEPGSEPVMRSQAGVLLAQVSKDPAFLFVQYHDLCADPQREIERIYEHCEWDMFTHDFDHVINQHPEDDSVYGLFGMHEIRERVSPWATSRS